MARRNFKRNRNDSHRNKLMSMFRVQQQLAFCSARKPTVQCRLDAEETIRFAAGWRSAGCAGVKVREQKVVNYIQHCASGRIDREYHM